MEQIITFIIYALAAAIVGAHIAYEAEIVQDIKRWLCIDREHSILSKLSNYNSYSMDMLWAYYVMLPFIILIKKIIYAVNCPFCLAYHLSWIIGIFLLDMEVIPALLLSFISILFTHLYRKGSL